MVIQRWQSVLLLVAAVVMGIFCFLPVATIGMPEMQVNFRPLGFVNAGIPTDGTTAGYIQSTWWYFVLAMSGAVLPLIDIFMYRNLRLQMNVCVMSIMIQLAVLVCGGVLIYSFADGNPVTQYQMCCAPIIAIVACVMSWQRINRDKNLLESADRLR